ncbi:MAG: orotidine-5'-phosphate decarboxylase [Chloroflexota bacterium]|nr:orotidine-5'-phosphate decarboxylase [Chloroflexota bacterium]MDE2897315.1 orotidine-5'-phosphate decarboxylase [Chloroflexota bacterium]
MTTAPDRPPPGFSARLWEEAETKQSWLCLGLDLDLARLPIGLPPTVDGARRFLYAVVDACADVVVAFKPNVPFYLALGPDGLRLLRDLRDAVGDRALLLVDNKVGDVADTSERYAAFLFDYLQADAITFNPWGGRDAIQPLIERPERGAFAWLRSSNPGADVLQGLQTASSEPVYTRLARRLVEWNELGNLGVVVGATRPDDVATVREVTPGLPILAPGVGAQGGALEATVRAGFGPAPAGVLVNAGRSALWAGDGPDYAQAVRAKVEEMRTAIEAARRS